MEQKIILDLLCKLRESDETERLNNAKLILETLFKQSSSKERELLREEFNRLSKEIEGEVELQKTQN